jgi:hypothetical protein
MKKWLLIFSLGIVGVSYGQVVDYRNSEHYVVKNNGDTIYGKLKYTSGDDIKNKIMVKENDTLKHNFKAQEIKLIRDGEKYYKVFQPDLEEYFFIKIWEEGKYLSLYEWQTPSDFNDGKIEFIVYVRQNDDKSFVQLETHWQKHIAELIADNAQMADDILKSKYKMEQLGDVIRHYNDWKAKNK